jgi:hypothetical protein
MFTYPTTPDTSIQVGDTVRSFDFFGTTSCYVVGTVEDIQVSGGCQKYFIRVTERVWDNRPDTCGVGELVYTPVNGVAMSFGGLCRGVQRV